MGNDAWILSYREECFDQIGLKPSIKIPVFNGSLECEFRKYQMFDGKMRIFRSEGGTVKTEEEKRVMAEKRRFKQNREFKKRLDEQEENAEADIRTFKFRSLERKAQEAQEARDNYRSSKSPKMHKTYKPYDSQKSQKPYKPYKSNKPFKKNNRRFRDDED